MSIPCPVIGPDGTEYPSLARAALDTGIDRKKITRMIEAGDKGWRWRDDAPPVLPERSYTAPTRAVVDRHGRVYASAAEVARLRHVSPTTVRHWCRDPASGWHYEDEPPACCGKSLQGFELLDKLGPIYADDVQVVGYGRERAA